MVFLRRICSSRPGDGDSADRAWQLSQPVTGVFTAFNPSHGSLSYVQARLCVSKQIGQHDAACQGCPRCVSRSPKARFRIVARCARFPTCGVVRVAGYSVVWDCDPTPVFLLKSTKRSAAAIIRPQRSFITFHGALRNIMLSTGFPAMFHIIASEQMFVNNLSQKIFLAAAASESNRFYQ